MQRYDARTALVVVDLQNDFADAAGALAVHGGANLVPIINAEVTMARDAGATIVFSQDWHPTETPHFVTSGGTWPVHCVAGTWGAELHPDVDPAAAGGGRSNLPVRQHDAGCRHPFLVLHQRHPQVAPPDATA